MENGLAGIEYHGLPGNTSRCLDALVRLIHFGEKVERASLVTCENTHGFLIELEFERLVAVKAGFSSGYPGEGPRGLAKALLLLKRHCEEIEEFEVSRPFMERLDHSCLFLRDLDQLSPGNAIRPKRYSDYIYDQIEANHKQSLDDLIDEEEAKSHGFVPLASQTDLILNDLFPREIPFSILDDRIVDLAFKFIQDPDGAILTAYKRLEGIIRARIGGSEKTGSKLIGSAFLSGPGTLQWAGLHDTEQRGRVQIFAGAFMSFRNRRAHHEVKLSIEEELREFLLVNELFLQERSATKIRPDDASS